MARGKQLLSLIAQLRAETGRTQNVAVGVDEVENLKVILQRTQELLYEEYEWPHLRVQRTITLANNQRYYDLPADLNFDRIQDVKLKYNGVYVPIERGILLEDYSIYDSNASPMEKSFPTLKWDIRDTGSAEKLEAWPVPNQAATIYLLGTKKLGDLIEESDTADLDDRLIVLFAAAEILARQKSNDAKNKLSQAERRLMMLRRNSQSDSKMVQVGLGNRNGNRPHSGKTTIVVS
jgi:hypothetical protein